MTIAAATFVFTLTIVLGSYWALVMRPEGLASGRLRQRLQLEPDRAIGAASIIKGGTATAAAGLLARWQRRFAVAPTERLLERAGMTLDPKRLVSGTAGTLTVVMVLMQAFTANWVVALCAGVITPFVPYAYLRNAARKRVNAFEELFPEAIDLMSRALRAGHTLTTSLAMIADEIPDPVKTEFRALYEQHNYGLPLAQVLRAFANRIPLVDAKFFVTAVLTQRETGGNLAEVLDNLAAVTRDRFRVRRQIKVLTAQGRMTGWVLSLLPVGLAVLLYVFNPGHMDAFLKDPLGQRLLEIAIVLQVVGVLIIRAIVKVEY